MAIETITRWIGSAGEALPVARKLAQILKSHGATSVRFGQCHAGPDSGHLYVAITFPDEASLSKAHYALSRHSEWRTLYGRALRTGKFSSRSMIVSQEL
jgi:hypothetical protein